MTYINQYKDGDTLRGIYLCKTKQILKTKAGKTYYSMILQDKTGTMDAKIWELHNGIASFEELDYIMVDGNITTFMGSKQANIQRLRKAQEGEYDETEYIPTSRYNIETMYEKLKEMIDSLTEPHLRELCELAYVRDDGMVALLKKHSAAKSVHHGFIGGLLQHTLYVSKLCDFFAKTYEYLDRNLLVSAALLHDIGKTKELSAFPKNDYPDMGQMLGHIYIGAEMIGRYIDKIEGFPESLAIELKHCILSHHGEFEYGSPKKPAIAEAFALHFADNLDAKMETLLELYEKSDITMDWLGYNKLLESNIRQSGGTLEYRKGSE